MEAFLSPSPESLQDLQITLERLAKCLENQQSCCQIVKSTSCILHVYFMYIDVYPNIYAFAVSDVCCRRKKVKAFRMALVSWRCNRSTFKQGGCPSPS